MKIVDVKARQILDSRGNPTVEADVYLESGVFGRAAVPSGASTGVHEAHELRDGGVAFGGKGVTKAVENIHAEIVPLIKNIPADDQNKLDAAMIELDSTENKSRLGANALLAVSLATAKAAARQRDIPFYQHVNDIAHSPKKFLPMPMMNVLNGGKHANNSSDFQEFMIIPVSADSIAQAVQMGAEVFQSLKKLIAAEGLSTAVGDEGGFTFPLKAANTEFLDLLMKAVEKAGYTPGKDVGFGLDIAASEFYEMRKYQLHGENRHLDSKEMVDYVASIAKDYPVISIEDGLAEDDWSAWTALTKKSGSVQLVGDDLLVTNPKRLQKGIDESAGNAILVKPNQIGTLSETVQTVSLAQENEWRTVMSHRSGETEDVSIAHLAVGLGTGQIKTGSLSRSDRVAKYNELMRIAEVDPEIPLAHPF